MKKPVLVVMAAGMGTRFGGPKQIEPMGKHGELLIDYSIYDAKKAGFEKVIFVVERFLEQDIKDTIGARLEGIMEVEYVRQNLPDTPKGFVTPIERIRPWGTAHAVLAARKLVDGPFAVINSDDYYGPNAFKVMYDFLSNVSEEAEPYQYAMVGYQLGNTVTENGTVSRGVCEVDGNGCLTKVTECRGIEKDGSNARYSEDEGKTWITLPGDATVSMNLWGFTPSFMVEAWARFPDVIIDALLNDPLDREYCLPDVVMQLLDEGKAQVKVLHTPDQWYGVTYKEDKPAVAEAIAKLVADGAYPEDLWQK